MYTVLNILADVSFQFFDKGEMLECINKLVELEQDWVPHSLSSSLYIRPTFIATEVSGRITPPERSVGVLRSVS